MAVSENENKSTNKVDELIVTPAEQQEEQQLNENALPVTDIKPTEETATSKEEGSTTESSSAAVAEISKETSVSSDQADQGEEHQGEKKPSPLGSPEVNLETAKQESVSLGNIEMSNMEVEGDKVNNDEETIAKEATTKNDSNGNASGEEGKSTPSPNGVAGTQRSKKRRSLHGIFDNTTNEDCQRLKRRKIKAAGAPKLPLTGYVRYMNDRRKVLQKEFPDKAATEHTKMICEEWHKLPEDKKLPYIKAAEIDKARYLEELEIFFKSNPDVLACEIAKNKQFPRRSAGSGASAGAEQAGKSSSVLKDKTQINGNAGPTKESTAKQNPRNSNGERKRTPTPPHSGTTVAVPTTPATTVTATTQTATTFAQHVPGEIPIFTNEFLEHNKIVDMELRTLRKSKADLEQQNAVLEKHVENMKFGVLKMTSENDELQEKNRLLQVYLEKLKQKLVQALAGLPLPSEPDGATVDNIEKYMTDLYKMSSSNNNGPASLNKARDIIRKLDLSINLY